MSFVAADLVATIRLDGVDKVGRDLGTVQGKLTSTDQAVSKVSASTKGASTELSSASVALSALTVKLRESGIAYEHLGRTGLAVGTIIAAGIAVAVTRFAEFDAQMSNVSAATSETASNMELLRTAAIDAGASTVYSATEAAGAIEELAKAGISTADILAGALRGSLDLAAAGQLDVARAAEITSTALNQYGLSGEMASHVSDVLAAGAGKAMGSVEDLANGLKFVGPVAASMGVSLEETTGVLALFAQQGILGEQAGTSLRGVLASLTSPSAEARREIERLGLKLYDAQGNFLGLENAAEQLSTAYTTMDGASRDASLGIVFGRETVTAATALYKAGAKGVVQWTDAVDDSGYAAEQARKRLDNLKGDLEALGGALDSALIQTGSGANAVLRDMVQALTGLVNMYGELPQPVQDLTLAIGGGTAAIALAGGTALLSVPKFLEMRAAFNAAEISMGGVALKAGVAGLALGGLFAIVGQLAQRHAEAQAKAESYAETLEDSTHRITEATKKLVAENLQKTPDFWEGLFGKVDGPGSALDAAQKLGLGLDTVTEAAAGSSKAIGELSPYLKRIREDSAFAATESKRLGIAQYDLELAALKVQNGIKGESDSLDEAARLARQKEAATKALVGADEESADASKTSGAAYLEAAGNVDKLRSELEKLVDTVNKANGVGQDAISANLAYQDALAKVDEQIQKARDGVDGYALTLDTNTQAGRDNLGMLNDLAKQSQDAAQAQFDLDHNTDAFKATLEAGRQTLIDRATSLGMNAHEASRLADQIYRIPPATEWTMIAQTSEAQRRLDTLTATINAIPSERRVGIVLTMPNGTVVSDEQLADQFGIGARASGGPIIGPGTGTSDSIPTRLSNGEHVWTAAEVNAAGGHGGVYRLRRAVLDGALRLATGGPVLRSVPSTWALPPRPPALIAAPALTGTLGGAGASAQEIAAALAAALREYPQIAITQMYPIHTDPLSDAQEAADMYNAGR